MSHKNILADVSSVAPYVNPTEDDIHISFLPLQHLFERMMIQLTYVYGAKAGFYQGDVQKLAEDLSILKPTIFPCVPRLLNRFYDLMQKKLADITGMKKMVVNWAIRTKLKNLEADGTTHHDRWDEKVFNKFKAM